MMKRIVFLIFVVFTFSFGQVNDSGNYLTAEEKQEVEKNYQRLKKMEI